MRQLLSVRFLKCEKCNSEWHDVGETADVDYVSCYCCSLYDPVEHQLVIAEVTNDELVTGFKGYFDKRINSFLGTERFSYIDYQEVIDKTGEKDCKEICPSCGVPMEEIKHMPLDKYTKQYNNTLLVYKEDNGDIKVKELKY